MKSIVWLASYPKSGNTWVRAFLANYLFAQSSPLSINAINRVGLGDAIAKMYKLVCSEQYQPANTEQFLQLRDKVLQGIVNNKANVNFVKTHNANISVNESRLFPKSLTRLSVYIVRNPLDVAVSYAKQQQLPYGRVVEVLCNPNTILEGSSEMAMQFFCDWSTHVDSWINNDIGETMVIRYEDLLDNPAHYFMALIKRIGLPVDESQLAKAIEFSSFNVLQRQEAQHGFVENQSAAAFFRRGVSGEWRQQLSQENIDTIFSRHGQQMHTLGYFA